MKALIIKQGAIPPKIDDLRKLDRILNNGGIDLHEPNERLRRLSMSAVFSHYPGDASDRTVTENALEICSDLRSRMLVLLQN